MKNYVCVECNSNQIMVNSRNFLSVEITPFYCWECEKLVEVIEKDNNNQE